MFHLLMHDSSIKAQGLSSLVTTTNSTLNMNYYSSHSISLETFQEIMQGFMIKPYLVHLRSSEHTVCQNMLALQV